MEGAKFFENGEIKLTLNKLISSTHDNTHLIWLVTYSESEYILKSIKKSSIPDSLQLEHLFNERNAYKELAHPAIPKLIKTFKDEYFLYMLITLAYGVPLHKVLISNKFLSENFVLLISAQLIVIFEYLQSSGYIYRDLKASNIIIDINGKITLIDFGFCKKIEKEKTNSFCGTIHAMPKEFFNDEYKNGYSYEIDSYSFGILIYELIVGQPCFGYENNNKNIREDIIVGIEEKKHLKGCIQNDKLIDLLRILLSVDAKERILFNEIKKHCFFQNIDWELINDILFGKEISVEKESVVLNEFDLKKYQEDIYLFGINKKENKINEVVSEEKMKEFDEIFS